MLPRKSKSATLSILSFLSSLFIISSTIFANSQWIRRDDLFGVSFVDEAKGWVGGRWGAIWHTDDGGRTWSQQKSGTALTLSSIFFIDARSGWAVGDNGTIIHTRDGGNTWQKQESPVPFYHRDVYFVSQSIGWIASEKTHILHTKDGGNTWTVQFSDEVYKLVSISFYDENNGWAVGEYGLIYHTNDGGKNWNHQAGFIRINDDTGDIETGVFLFDIVAIDPKTALAVGADSLVTRTSDSGQTWNSIRIGDESSLLYSAAYDGKNTIIVGGKGAYFTTSDLGETWIDLTFNPTMIYSWLYAFTHKGNSIFVGVGEEGAIYLSNTVERWKRVNY